MRRGWGGEEERKKERKKERKLRFNTEARRHGEERQGRS
jgi:hypothetical protein